MIYISDLFFKHVYFYGYQNKPTQFDTSMNDILPTILIVEDDSIITQNLLETLKDLGYDDVVVAHDTDTALHLFEAHNPDICLFDISLDGSVHDGIELANILSSRVNFQLIFMTAFSDKATVERAMKVVPSAYLVKPVSQDQLKVAIDFAVVRFQMDNNKVSLPSINRFIDYIFVKAQDRFVKLRGDDIIYIKADGSYCEIQTISDKIIVSRHLASLLSQLKNENILQCHRSYAVNINFITAFDFNFIFLKNKDEEESIPYSVSYKESLLHYLPKLK